MLKLQTAPVFANAVTWSMSVSTLHDFVLSMFKGDFATKEEIQHEGQGYARLRDA
jgi:hypothetical protein